MGSVYSSLNEAIAASTQEQRPIFAVIYDSKHRSQSKLNYSLGYFLEYETTKILIRDNFVQALLDVHSPGVRAYVPINDPLENCLLLVLRPDRTIVKREGVYANPDKGLSRTRSIVQSIDSPSIRKIDSDPELKTSTSPTESSELNPLIQEAPDRMTWSKDGTVARSIKRHGYYRIRKQYVPEPGVEEERYLGWYQAGGHVFDPNGGFMPISGPIHGYKTLQEAQRACEEEEEETISRHLGL